MLSGITMTRGVPHELPEPMESLWKKAMENPDYQMYKNIYNLLAQKGQSNPKTQSSD